MKKISVFLSTLFLATAFLIPDRNAMADAFTTSTAQLTYHSFEIQGDIDIEMDDRRYAYGSANDGTGAFDEMEDDTDQSGAHALASVSHANAQAFGLDDGIVNATSEASSSSGASFAYAEANASILGVFNVVGTGPSGIGTGSLSISFDYLLSQGSHTETPYDFVSSGTSVFLGIFLNPTGPDTNEGAQTDGDLIMIELNTPACMHKSLQGMLSVSLDFSAGDWGVVYAGVATDNFASTVPVPASLLLLGTGLIGLAAFRRKKTKT